ncbi:hypothetical protein GQ55_7G012100 [Panicum hallii var. hallii]|uniref:Uncharacterized protein n=1 Tax=Panicum hallii var. hallii TaxID=1504633 RepID=A0A2T7CRP0_9POAL|nr:hypothetical protein GQ55_7G012100 [Panicum hallii var. hallii]
MVALSWWGRNEGQHGARSGGLRESSPQGHGAHVQEVGWVGGGVRQGMVATCGGRWLWWEEEDGEEREGVLARAVPCGSEGRGVRRQGAEAGVGRGRRQWQREEEGWGAGGSATEREEGEGEEEGEEKKRKREKEKGKWKERKGKESKSGSQRRSRRWSGTRSCRPCGVRRDVQIKEKVLVGFGAGKWELDRLKRVFENEFFTGDLSW